MSVESMETGVDEPGCERCSRPLPPKSRGGKGGRPFRFCPDSADEPGTSCLELDRRDRNALERAGLGDLVAAVRAATAGARTAVAPVLSPVTALTERLQHLEHLVDRIDQTAIARVEEADAARLRAEAAQRAAERAAAEADVRARRAGQLRDDAFQARDTALDNEQSTREQAGRDVDAAQKRAAEAERLRGQAEGAATEHRRALDEERQRRETADNTVQQLREQLDAAHQQNTVLVGERDAARRQAVEDQATIGVLKAANAGLISQHSVAQAGLEDRDRQIAELRQHWTAATEQANGLAEDLGVVQRERAEFERAVIRLTAELDAARSAADKERTTLASRADDADRRYEGLLAALAGGGFSAASGGPTP